MRGGFSRSAAQITTEEVDGGGADDRRHPAVEVFRAGEVREARGVVDDADEGLLNDIEAEGFIAAGHRAGKAECPREPCFVQGGEGGVVAAGESVERLAVGFSRPRSGSD